ncbi:MAG: type II toxin-antitoxin system PemK/MazF family toxin [Leptolyngbyaceae cyanobacterium SL_7_1]|nr:type II toxin-antitoxin system PemK/MazF family toxin [Leptolyngbyaceae cyanobacterium SL_7_1]
MNPKLGEVWLVDLGLAAKMRPVVIVSRYDPTPPRALVLYIPVTTQNRGSCYEVELPTITFLKEGSVANVQGLGSVPVARLERRLGHLPDEAILEIKQALVFALDLEDELEQNNAADSSTTP